MHNHLLYLIVYPDSNGVFQKINPYYDKNKENINIKNLARYRLGTSFYSYCNIYTNLYE